MTTGMSARLSALLKKPALRQGGAVVVDQGFLSAAMFITSLLLARASIKEEYALYVLGWSLLMILQGFPKALINTPVTVYTPRLSPDERRAYHGSTLIHIILICVTIVTGMLIVYWWSAEYGSPKSSGLIYMLPLLVLVLVPLFLREYIRNALLAQLDIWTSTRANIFSTLILFVAVSWMYTSNVLTVNTALAAIAATSLIAVLSMSLTYYHHITLFKRRIFSDLKKNWKIGKWILINVFAFMGASQAYPWLLLYFLGAESVAVFGVCFTLAAALNPLLVGASGYIFPRMAHSLKNDDLTNLIRLMRKSMLMLSIPFLLWLILGSIFSEQLITILYSGAYQGFGVLFVLLLIKAAIESISTPIAAALQTLERTNLITLGLITGAGVTLLLGPVMIVKFGLNGAGVSAIMAAVVSSAVKLWGLRKALRTKDVARYN
jgi:O-antigen/teichoic acid export membrane protein